MDLQTGSPPVRDVMKMFGIGDGRNAMVAEAVSRLRRLSPELAAVLADCCVPGGPKGAGRIASDMALARLESITIEGPAQKVDVSRPFVPPPVLPAAAAPAGPSFDPGVIIELMEAMNLAANVDKFADVCGDDLEVPVDSLVKKLTDSGVSRAEALKLRSRLVSGRTSSTNIPLDTQARESTEARRLEEARRAEEEARRTLEEARRIQEETTRRVQAETSRRVEEEARRLKESDTSRPLSDVTSPRLSVGDIVVLAPGVVGSDGCLGDSREKLGVGKIEADDRDQQPFRVVLLRNGNGRIGSTHYYRESEVVARPTVGSIVSLCPGMTDGANRCLGKTSADRGLGKITRDDADSKPFRVELLSGGKPGAVGSFDFYTDAEVVASTGTGAPPHAGVRPAVGSMVKLVPGFSDDEDRVLGTTASDGGGIILLAGHAVDCFTHVLFAQLVALSKTTWTASP